jgi:hypothetical protein
MQEAIVIVLVTACFLWLAYMGYRYLRPKPGSSACRGGCCDMSSESPPPSSPGRTQMVSSDDLRTRLKARTRGG